MLHLFPKLDWHFSLCSIFKTENYSLLRESLTLHTGVSYRNCVISIRFEVVVVYVFFFFWKMLKNND